MTIELCWHWRINEKHERKVPGRVQSSICLSVLVCLTPWTSERTERDCEKRKKKLSISLLNCGSTARGWQKGKRKTFLPFRFHFQLSSSFHSVRFMIQHTSSAVLPFFHSLSLSIHTRVVKQTRRYTRCALSIGTTCRRRLLLDATNTIANCHLPHLTTLVTVSMHTRRQRRWDDDAGDVLNDWMFKCPPRSHLWGFKDDKKRL